MPFFILNSFGKSRMPPKIVSGFNLEDLKLAAVLNHKIQLSKLLLTVIHQRKVFGCEFLSEDIL